MAARDSLIAGVAGRDVTVMTLTSAAAKDPYARMFWDRARHTWTIIAHNMPALKSGRTYQLWLVTPKAKISAGTFAVRNGEAVVSRDVRSHRSAARRSPSRTSRRAACRSRRAIRLSSRPRRRSSARPLLEAQRLGRIHAQRAARGEVRRRDDHDASASATRAEHPTSNERTP